MSGGGADPLILVVGHGDLAAGLVASAEMILGATEGLIPVALRPGESPEAVTAAIAAATAGHAGRPRLILVDLFGGSPATASARLLEGDPSLEIVTGVNLPMLLETILQRGRRDVRSLASHAAASGHQGIVEVAGKLRAEGILKS